MRTTHSPTKSVNCMSRVVDDVYLKQLFNQLPKDDLERRIEKIEDPNLRDHANKIARAVWIA